jgi:hypothetical protein
VGTSPIHKDPGCRAPNERCDNLSGPVVRKSTIRENAFHLSSAISRKRRAGGVPSQRETHRKSGSPDRTAPSTPPPDVAQGSKRTSGPPAESENRPKNRRGSTGKARAASPADGNREGTARQTTDIETPGRGARPGPPPAKIQNFGPQKQRQKTVITGTPAAARNRRRRAHRRRQRTERTDSQPRRCVAEGPRSTPPTTDAEKGSNGRQPVIGTRRQ